MADEKFLAIGEAAEMLDVSQNTLRRWDEQGILKSVHLNQSKHRRYREEDIQALLLSKNDLAGKAWKWIASNEPLEPETSYYCQTRDIFSARLERMKNDLNKQEEDNRTALVVAIAGEIGNNSFDHNVGSWRDIPGIFFGYDVNKRELALADRGQGVLTTLRRVRPTLKDDITALKTAFTEIISGRAPEARGNGLKFVRQAIALSGASLTFQSGNGRVKLTDRDKKMRIHRVSNQIQGCLVVIKF